jgi:hypothetical protein
MPSKICFYSNCVKMIESERLPVPGEWKGDRMEGKRFRTILSQNFEFDQLQIEFDRLLLL